MWQYINFPPGMLSSSWEARPTPLTALVPTVVCVVPVRIIVVVSSTTGVLFLGLILRAVIIDVRSPVYKSDGTGPKKS